MESNEDSMGEVPVVAPTSGRSAGAKRETKSNVATLANLNSSSDDEEDEEKGQAFYAGGSQHSGQQVLGPPRKKDPIKDYVQEVFKKAQSGQLDQFNPHDAPGGSGGAAQTRSFVGSGYRLGQTDDDHQVVQSGGAAAAKKKAEECDAVTVKVYSQGFTVDDGELRPYEDPRNREFFESITRNEIPAELRKQGRSMVHVNVEDHLHENYVKQTAKFKAFTGSGNTLGSPTPATTAEIPVASGDPAENEAAANRQLNVQQDQPSTMISIRLADGGRLSTRFNLTHTIEDIRSFINAARPQYADRSFALLTTFPNKELSNNAETIQQAGLQNAAILQRLK